MSDKPDGGPAFPFACQGPTTAPETYYGMDMRDYFAAKALQSFLTIPGATSCTEESIARAAYQQADAMLEERNKEN